MGAVGTLVLIHGGWHAAWCWQKLIPLLERQGQRVIAPDLPGHGLDPTPLSEKPYELYVPKLCAVLNALEEPAIVVGHSSGGMIITEASRRCGERIRGLVYLSAFLLPPGRTPRDVMQMDDESLLASSLKIDRDKRVSVVKPECARSVFYADCTDEDAAWAVARLQPEPLIPPGPAAPGDVEVAASVSLPRFYIECLADRALSPSVQRWMYTEAECDAVYSLPTSHSPFLSAPAALAQHLLAIHQTLA